ncbi:MAG TPA: FecR family protein [Methylomirabilota bacterium]|nr:FecR family protein [Methylomirabilota bacterium]
MRVGRIVVAVSLIAGLLPVSVSAQATKAGVVTTLEGSVTAARTTAAQPVALKFKDDVFVNDRVVTGDRSLARLLLGGKAVVTVRERSALTITEVPGRSTIDLDSGKVAVAVAKDKMRPSEQVEVKTPNAVAAVRGTVFIAEVVRASADNAQGGTTANFYVLTGTVAVTSGTQTVDVGANNFASVTGNVVNTGVMSVEMRANATGGLSSNLPKVNGGEDNAKQTVMDSTVATFSAASLPIVTPPTTPTPPTVQIVTNPPLTPGGNPQLTVPPPPTSTTTTASGILLYGDANLVPLVGPGFRAALESDLRTLQPNVLLTNLNSPTLPADLSAFASIWYVGAFEAISATDRTRLAQFLARGGGLYLTGERSCCQRLNDSVQSLLRQVVSGGDSIVVGSLNEFLPPAAFNPTARGGITKGLTLWFPNGPGEIFNISGANVLATIGEAIVAGVWSGADLKGNAGRIVLMMDINWLSDAVSRGQCNDDCRRAILANLLAFLDDPAGPLVLSGPLFRSVDETLSTQTSFFDLPRLSITSTSLDPLFWFSGSTLTTAGVFARMTESTIATAGSFLRLDSGARITQTGTDPLVSMSGGSLAVGTGGDGHLFDLVGRASFTEVDADSGLRVGTDRPIQPGAEAPVFATDNGTVVNVRGSAYKVDTALLEATAPLLTLKGGTTFTTGDHAVSLIGGAKVSIPNDAVSMVTLQSSMLTVARGNLVNVAGGSVLNIAGNLVSLADASTLSILNGLLLNVSGGSYASIGRSLVSFSGAGNVLNVTNTIVPTAIINGIPVAGPADSFRIGANAIGGTGSGTIRINGVALNPSTPLSSLTGSLVAIQGAGTVKVGQ